MKKIILFLILVAVAFGGWKYFSSRQADDSPVNTVEESNTVSANEEASPEPTTAAQTSVQVLPAKQ